MRKRDIIKMMYGSTMFGKLWEWIMGIIAWIMSKFSRKSVGGASEPAEVEQAAVADSAAPEQEQAPTPNPSE